MMSIDKNKVLSNDNLLGLRGGAGDVGNVYCKKWSEPDDIKLGTVEADCANALSACSEKYPETDYATCLPQ